MAGYLDSDAQLEGQFIFGSARSKVDDPVRCDVAPRRVRHVGEARDVAMLGGHGLTRVPACSMVRASIPQRVPACGSHDLGHRLR